MTRRLRSKTRKYAGDRTFGGGNTKNRRGKGSKGGRGRAGFHKHKWLRTAKYELETLRRNHLGFKSIYKPSQTVTLEQVNRVLEKGKVEKKDGVVHFSFPKAKVIGSTPLVAKVHVTAMQFSKGAKLAIEKAGGTVVMPVAKQPHAPKTAPTGKPKAASGSK